MSKKNKILVVGSVAFDHVMRYAGQFDNVIIPGNPNLTVTATDHQINYGGCAANIAYSLRLHDEHPIVMSCVGYDFGEYRSEMEKRNIDLSGLCYSKDVPTASAFIVSDKNSNQITIFEPGAMHSNENEVGLNDVDSHEVGWAIIAPDHPKRMVKIADECFDAGIPYIFDPSQQLNVFAIDDLKRVAQRAEILIVNEYEAKLMKKLLSLSDQELRALAGTYIETRGDQGGTVSQGGHMVTYGAVEPIVTKDPTGCGDAFRAGLVTGLIRGFDLVKSCKMGALTATYSIEFPATQMHKFGREEFAARFRKSYGEDL